MIPRGWLAFVSVVALSGCRAAALVEPAVVSAAPEPSGAWSDRYVSPSAYAYYIEARIDYDGGRLDAAHRNLTLALAFDPESPYLHAYRAWMLAEGGDREQAEAELAIAEELHSSCGYVPYVEARLAAEDERWDVAADAASRAVEVEPDLVDAYTDLVRYQRKLGRRAAAKSTLQRMIERWPLNPRSHMELGELAMEDGEIPVAVEHFEEVVRLRPRMTSGYYKLAAAHAKAGDLQAAYDVFVECTDARTRSPGCWFQRVLIARRRALNSGEVKVDGLAPRVALEVREMAVALSAHPPLAAAAASRMVDADNLAILKAFVEASAERRPVLRELIFYLGRLYQRRGRRDEALAAFAKLTPGSAFFVEGRTQLSILLSEGGHHRRALAAIDAAIDAEPAVVELRTLRSALCERAHRPDEALASLRRAAELAPDRVDLHARVATLAWEQGRERVAEAENGRVLELEPDNVGALSFAALMLAERRVDLDRAERLALRAKSLRDNDASVLHALGWVYYRTHREEEAVTLLERAAELAPAGVKVLEHLGDAYRRAGRRDDAQAAYRRAQKACQGCRTMGSLRKKLAATVVGRR